MRRACDAVMLLSSDRILVDSVHNIYIHYAHQPCHTGDRGLRYTELTSSSLQHLELPSNCSDGYSTSRTCEMSLSNHSGINFRGLVYLLDEATSPKPAAAEQQQHAHA